MARSGSLLFLLFLLLPGAQFRAPAIPPPKVDAVLTRGPYPQMATPTGVTIVWRTRSIILPELKIESPPGTVLMSVPMDQIVARRKLDEGASSAAVPPLHSAPAGTIQFEAPVTGLEPDKKYYYAVYDGPKRLTPVDESCCFQTLPLPGTERPFSFWVVGDSGTASASQKAVAASFREWCKKHRRSVDFYMHVGDMAYNKGLDSEFQYSFFEIYNDLLRGLTCWPVIGNHEETTSKSRQGTGPYYDAYVSPTKAESGGTPSGTEAYYSWDYGTTHFIALDSSTKDYRSKEGAMAQWLKADLEKTKAAWIIAYWHHPPYSKGSHDSDKDKELIAVRGELLPIIEAGGVDLVITGHSHIYERSFLLNGAYATPTVAKDFVFDDRDGDPKGQGPYRKRPGILPNEGTVQIVAGHGGQALSRTETPSPVMRKTITEWGSVIVEVDGDKLTATMLNSEGRERDRVQIVKDARNPPKPVLSPRKPESPEGPRRRKYYDAANLR